MTIRRLKTYAGAQGFVYEYYFVGKRPAGEATEYVFDVTSDRKQMYAVRVLLPAGAVAAWASAHGRELSDSEQYAAVKMRLFRAFDEIAEMQTGGRKLDVDLDSLQESLKSLGINE